MGRAGRLAEQHEARRVAAGVTPARWHKVLEHAEPPPFHGLFALPAPDAADLFFDFEGDPLYTEAADGVGAMWGIDYLFGWVDDDEQYAALWAHSFADEKRALEDFLDVVALRRRALGLTVLLGLGLFLLLGKDPLRGLQMFFWEPIKSAYAWSELGIKATPLVLIALGLAGRHFSEIGRDCRRGGRVHLDSHAAREGQHGDQGTQAKGGRAHGRVHF